MHESMTVRQCFEGLVQGFLNMPMEYLSTAIAIICGLFIWAAVYANADSGSSLGVCEWTGRTWRSWKYRFKSRLERKVEK